jgi:hypothetical protein
VRFLALIAVLISLAACSGPGYVRNTLAPEIHRAPSNPTGDTVLLIAVDGLRAEELRRYLRTLRREHHEPHWRSGISMLKRAGKRLVRAQNAAASLSTDRGAIATLLTGYTAQVHGQPASAWIASPAQRGVQSKVGLGGIVTAYDDALGVPDTFKGTLPVPTLIEALPDVRSAAIFLPFTGKTQAAAYRPANRADFAAWLDDRTGENVAPLIDRTAREIAVELLQSARPPNLLVVGMRGMHGASDQQSALRAIDGHLARMLAAMRRAHPARIPKLHLMLVGTSPTTPLTQHPRAFNSEAVRTRFIELVPNCAAVLSPDQLRIVAAGRTARLYAAPTVAAQSCLHGALRAARLHASAWMDGAAWRADGRTQTFVSHRVTEDLGAIRTRRLVERMQIAAGGPLGDAVIFAAPTITFGPVGREAAGGIRPDAIDAPLLLASAAISDATADRIASAAIEMTDIAPTVVQLLRGAWPDSKTEVERRSSLLIERAGRWTLVPAARLELPVAPRDVLIESAPPLQNSDFGTPAVRCLIPGLNGGPKLALRVANPAGLAWAGLHWDSRYAVDQRRTTSSLVTVFTFPPAFGEPPAAGVKAPISLELGVNVQTLTDLLSRLRRNGPIGPRQRRSALFARFGETPATILPRDAFITVIACDAYDRCQSKALMSDRDLETLARRCR